MTDKPVEYYKVGEVVIHQGVPPDGTHKGTECTILEPLRFRNSRGRDGDFCSLWCYEVDIPSIVGNDQTIIAKQEWLSKKHDKGTMNFNELIKSLDKELIV